MGEGNRGGDCLGRGGEGPEMERPLRGKAPNWEEVKNHRGRGRSWGLEGNRQNKLSREGHNAAQKRFRARGRKDKAGRDLGRD